MTDSTNAAEVRLGTSSAPSLYDSAHRPPRWIEEAVQLWRYRGLVHELVIRDIKVRYKRSVLGILWTMLAPLLNMVALTLVFSSILKTAIQNYPVYFMTGSIFWAFFSQTTSTAALQTTSSNELAKRMFVPRSVFIASAVGGGLVNLVLSLVPLILIIAVTGYPFHATWAFLPVSIFVIALFTAGISFLLFTVTSRFADVREMYTVLVQTWFFLTPIVYEPSIVPFRYRVLLSLNPMYHLIQVFRKPIYDGVLPSPTLLAGSLALSVAILVTGWVYFCHRADRMAYWS
ncbi:MAG TPA: ABC transporter permease [Thermoanaerobaculia bacterium]|jgi:ABC-type polysaccharide/polyol phosphate export permease